MLSMLSLAIDLILYKVRLDGSCDDDDDSGFVFLEILGLLRFFQVEVVCPL